MKDKRDYMKVLFTLCKNEKDLNIFVGKVAQYKRQGVRVRLEFGFWPCHLL